MLKKRLIAVITIKDGLVVQSIGFNRYLPIGKPEIAVDFLNQWRIDEIIVLDISTTRQKHKPDIERMRRMKVVCRAPLTYGGGIRSIDEITSLLANGADKVSLNRIMFDNPVLITEAARRFGKQCIVASIDVKKINDDRYAIYNYLTGAVINRDLVEFCQYISRLGAGEIFLNSVDQDGQKKGFDITMVQSVASTVDIPVIACGGAGHPCHFLQVLNQTDAAAAAAGNFWHFTEHSVMLTKAILFHNNLEVRVDDRVNYLGSHYLDQYRLGKFPDDYLEELIFERIEPEII